MWNTQYFILFRTIKSSSILFWVRVMRVLKHCVVWYVTNDKWRSSYFDKCYISKNNAFCILYVYWFFPFYIKNSVHSKLRKSLKMLILYIFAQKYNIFDEISSLSENCTQGLFLLHPFSFKLIISRISIKFIFLSLYFFS